MHTRGFEDKAKGKNYKILRQKPRLEEEGKRKKGKKAPFAHLQRLAESHLVGPEHATLALERAAEAVSFVLERKKSTDCESKRE